MKMTDRLGTRTRQPRFRRIAPLRCRRARDFTDARMGIELLLAGDPGRSDRGGHWRSALVGLRGLVGRFADRGICRPGGRARHRSPRRTRRVGVVERRAGCRSHRARGGKWCRPALRRLGDSRHRNDTRALRRRLCGAHRALWSRRAWSNHRHHFDRRLRVDGELAVVDISE